jgi:hypothetical protein
MISTQASAQPEIIGLEKKALEDSFLRKKR